MRASDADPYSAVSVASGGARPAQPFAIQASIIVFTMSRYVLAALSGRLLNASIASVGQKSISGLTIVRVRTPSLPRRPGERLEPLAEHRMVRADDDEGLGIGLAHQLLQQRDLAVVDRGEDERALGAGVAALRRAGW